jgi:hypothetical protein
MTRFKIDKGIPLPAAHSSHGRPRTWPWDTLEVGDSVLLSEYAAKTAEQWAQRNGRVFTRQKQPDGTGWRVWRKA